MQDYFGSLKRLWLISQLMTTKGVWLLTNFLKGHTREVDRVDHEETTMIPFVIQHLSNLVQDPSVIIDKIYLGSSFNSCNKETLDQYGILRILNVTAEIPCSYPEDYTYMQIHVRDCRDSFLESYVEEMYQFILTNPDQPILIHCYMGSSRSASIIIYYIMRRYHKSYDWAHAYVKERRSSINLNINFAQELQDMEKYQTIPRGVPTPHAGGLGGLDVEELGDLDATVS